MLTLAMAWAGCSRSDEQAKIAYQDRVKSAATLGTQYPRFEQAMAGEAERAATSWKAALAVSEEEARNDAMNDVVDDGFPVQHALKDAVAAVEGAEEKTRKLARRRVGGLTAVQRDLFLDGAEEDIAEAKTALNASAPLAGTKAVDLLEDIESDMRRVSRKAKDKLKALEKKKKKRSKE